MKSRILVGKSEGFVLWKSGKYGVLLVFDELIERWLISEERRVKGAVLEREHKPVLRGEERRAAEEEEEEGRCPGLSARHTGSTG